MRDLGLEGHDRGIDDERLYAAARRGYRVYRRRGAVRHRQKGALYPFGLSCVRADRLRFAVFIDPVIFDVNSLQYSSPDPVGGAVVISFSEFSYAFCRG